MSLLVAVTFDVDVDADIVNANFSFSLYKNGFNVIRYFAVWLVAIDLTLATMLQITLFNDFGFENVRRLHCHHFFVRITPDFLALWFSFANRFEWSLLKIPFTIIASSWTLLQFECVNCQLSDDFFVPQQSSSAKNKEMIHAVNMLHAYGNWEWEWQRLPIYTLRRTDLFFWSVSLQGRLTHVNLAKPETERQSTKCERQTVKTWIVNGLRAIKLHFQTNKMIRAHTKAYCPDTKHMVSLVVKTEMKKKNNPINSEHKTSTLVKWQYKVEAKVKKS